VTRVRAQTAVSPAPAPDPPPLTLRALTPHLTPRARAGAPLERWQLEAILDAARWAPTHKKTEPWRFVVLTGGAKAEFEGLTKRLVAERAPEEKREALIAKLERKAGKEWRAVAAFIAVCMKRHADQVGAHKGQGGAGARDGWHRGWVQAAEPRRRAGAGTASRSATVAT
jgi:nitroreductase